MAAFALAELQGAHGVELDLQITSDGVPVVLHDETLQRTTDGRGRVDALSWTALTRLDAGRWFAPEFAGERVPSLEQVLDWAGDRMQLNLEIKDPAVATAMLDELQRFPRCRVLVSSFDHRLLERLRTVAADLPLGFLSDSRLWRRQVERASRCRALSFHPRADRVSRPQLVTCRRLGLAVYPWTVDSPGVARRFRSFGVSGLFTNTPGRMAAEFGGSGPG